MATMATASLESVMDQLRAKGSEKTRATYARHGMQIERVYGVSVADLKLIVKPLRGQQELAYELYSTGIMDAMYLAGMIASGEKMSRDRLQEWVNGASGMQMISEYTVPWVSVESPHGWSLALEWIDSPVEHIGASGWCTLSGLVAVLPDDQLDLAQVEALVERVVREVPTAQNRVKQTMNGFVISVGGYIEALLPIAKDAAERMGKVKVDMGDTACKTPSALEYIAKMEGLGRIGKKRKTLRC